MTLEQFDYAAEECTKALEEFALFMKQDGRAKAALVHLKEILALAKPSIPSGQVAEDEMKIIANVSHECADGESKDKCQGCQMSDAAERLAAQAQSAQEWQARHNLEHALRVAREADADASNAAKEEAIREAEMLRERVAEIEAHASRLEEVARLAGVENEALKARASAAEALAKKHEQDAKDALASLDMYAKAWRRELGSFYRWKRHEIDALVVSTRDMAEEVRTLRAESKEIDALKADLAQMTDLRDASRKGGMLEHERANAAEAEVERLLAVDKALPDLDERAVFAERMTERLMEVLGDIATACEAKDLRDIPTVEKLREVIDRVWQLAREACNGADVESDGGSACCHTSPKTHAGKRMHTLQCPTNKASECEGEPGCGWHSGGPCTPCRDWTMRDEFAKAALQGLLANPSRLGDADAFARDAIMFADAVLNAMEAK